MKTIFTTLLLAASITLFGQTEEQHPIDIALQKCHDNTDNQTTHGMISCEETAAAQWDKELNNYYSKLGKILSADEKANLKASQLKWIEYRDKEFAFSDLMYGNLEGTMWLPMAAARRCNIVRARALELKHYYELLQDAK